MRVAEIFTSISGEQGLFRQGEFVTFIRLAGCNLRCSYCDTAKTQTDDWAEERTPLQVADSAWRRFGVRQFLITGGEPLYQKEELEDLCRYLRNQKEVVIQVETNGSIVPSGELCRLVDCWVVDYKLPSSGMVHGMLPIKQFSSFRGARRTWVKFVVADRLDFDMAVQTMRHLREETSNDFNYAFGPLMPRLTPHHLSSWLKEHHLNMRDDVFLNVQLHKLIDMA